MDLAASLTDVYASIVIEWINLYQLFKAKQYIENTS